MAGTKRKATTTPAGEKRQKMEKDPKKSHLYTDDNPETTLHGTGFKGQDAALRTIDLVSKRSLTYQFQTINTMLYRARGHKHKTPGIEAAIKEFQAWTGMYRDRKSELRSLPLLSKPKVKEYLTRFDGGELVAEKDDELKDAEAFARMYVDLGARKRLANTLVDNAHPGGEDWEIRRYSHLLKLVPEGKEIKGEDAWVDEKDRVPSAEHLKLILWAYSPVKKV